jgi:transposase-like protein
VALGGRRTICVKEQRLRSSLAREATPRQAQALAAYVEAGGSVADAAALVGIRPGTVRRHLADLRARSGLTTEQSIYAGCAAEWLVVPNREPRITDCMPPRSSRIAPSKLASPTLA